MRSRACQAQAMLKGGKKICKPHNDGGVAATQAAVTCACAMSSSHPGSLACPKATTDCSTSRDSSPVGLGPPVWDQRLFSAREPSVFLRMVLLQSAPVGAPSKVATMASQLRAVKPVTCKGPGDLPQFAWASLSLAVRFYAVAVQKDAVRPTFSRRDW